MRLDRKVRQVFRVPGGRLGEPELEAIRRRRGLRDFALIAFSLTLFTLALGGTLGWLSLRRLAENDQSVARTQALIRDLEGLRSTLADAETGQRGFLITGDETYLKPYDAALAQVQGLVDTVEARTADDPAQRSRMTDLEQVIGAKLSELRRTVAAARAGDREGAVRMVRGNEGQTLMEQVRAGIVTMQAAEQERQGQRALESEANRRRAAFLLMVTAALGVVLVTAALCLHRSYLGMRMQAAEILAAQRERLRVTLSSIADAVITTDSDDQVTFLNAAAETLTGWTAREAGGRPLAAVCRFADGNELVRRDGTTLAVEEKAAAILDRDGREIGNVLVLRDVTARKALEARTLQLVLALREADRRKDEFLAMLGHELRGPLAPLTNALEIMRHASGRDDLLEEARGTMERQIGQLTRLVEDLVDVSRVVHGKVRLRKEHVDLAAALQQAIETCRPLLDKAGHALSLRLPQQPLPLLADRARLAQVFTNLIGNAAKYTDGGGRIEVTAGRLGAEAEVSVHDNGIGIPVDRLEIIFGMFTQIDRKLDRSQGGLGIGLTLVRRLVEMHGGTVEARSDGPGRGSTFVVRLPLASPQAAADSAPGAGAEVEPFDDPAAPHRVLVVDDNPDTASSLATLLSMSGNVTRTAHDGPEAIDLGEEFHPDVVLLDLGLPGMSGYEACRRMRREPWGEDVMMVALTGWSQEADRARTTEAGFDHHLVKPIEPGVLLEVIAGRAPTAPT